VPGALVVKGASRRAESCDRQMSNDTPDDLFVLADVTFWTNRHAAKPPSLLSKFLGCLSQGFRVRNAVSLRRDDSKIPAELAKKLETPLTAS